MKSQRLSTVPLHPPLEKLLQPHPKILSPALIAMSHPKDRPHSQPAQRNYRGMDKQQRATICCEHTAEMKVCSRQRSDQWMDQIWPAVEVAGIMSVVSAWLSAESEDES